MGPTPIPMEGKQRVDDENRLRAEKERGLQEKKTVGQKERWATGRKESVQERSKGENSANCKKGYAPADSQKA